ncbi:B3 domain-containing protein [Raphanus sativus]|uniref:B3 domain-containing protein At2g31720 n=1 Tax=Raphanus sativus TaxID=3726 RepID=A0A9W3BZN3_RAPSA|nr:B3 domain-containing protein At2g31720 [Raphanus sativus]KAJ4891417.1 B3 domain-containing protein [Raphanus sativus]
MEMVTDGDDDQRSEEGSRGEKRCLNCLALVGGSCREEETRILRVREEGDSSSSYSSSSSWSLSSVESKRRRVVFHEPIRAAPLREVKPVIRRKKPVKPERGVTPEWLVNLMTRLNGVDVKLVIDKMIQTTDVNPNQARLLIPFNQIVEMDFLNEAELGIIAEHQRDKSKKGVDVTVVASDGREWNAKLRRWNMNCPNYALCSGWNNVVRENMLKNKVGQIFRLWSFHSQDGKLYLAFFHQPTAPDIPDLNVPFVQERDPLEAEQERHDHRRTWYPDLRLARCVYLNIPLVPVRTEMTSFEAVQETSLESARETTRTTVDLELRLGLE